MYSAEMERMQALFSRLKERRSIEYLSFVGNLERRRLELGTEGGVKQKDSEFNGDPAEQRC